MIEQITAFLSEKWFTVIQSAGIVASLLYAARTFQLQGKTRRVSNYIDLIKLHRELWKMPLDKPELYRAVDPDPALIAAQITNQERQFVSFMFLHLSCYVEMLNQGQIEPLTGIQEDIRDVLAAPIANRVWQDSRTFYNPQLVKFVEAACRLPVRQPDFHDLPTDPKSSRQNG